MSLIPLRRNRVKGYRLTYNGIGIYEALKKEMFNKTHTSDAWIEFKNSPECNWLPLPPTYGDNNASYFTEDGYNKFMELTMPIVNEYISSEDIETEVSDIPSNAIVYKDEYQFVIDTTKQEWDHDNHPYSFDNPNIYMRPATEDDVDNMYSWEMESIDKSLQEDPKVQQLIRDDCYQSIKDTQMIMDQDKTIGMFTACMIDNGEWRYIGEIYLIPEYRGQHIGSTILKNEIANYDRIRLQVAFDNASALRLYESLGFKIVSSNKKGGLYIMEYDKNSQDSSIKKVTLDDEYKTLYFGSKNEIDDDSIQLQNDELFVTPFITLASIFAVRPRSKDINLPRGSYNIGYDEWKKPIEELSQETEPLSEVHVIIEGLPDLKPFDYNSSGFIYVIDAEDVKDHLYQKHWMDDQREYIVKDLESVPIQQVIPVDAVCHIRGGDKMAEPVTEAFFKEAYLKAKERNSLKDSEFGISELRKYPLTDETHINMAVKFFGKAPKKYKLSLAKRILRAAHSHDMDTDRWDTINDYIKNHKESVVQEGFFEVGFGNLRKTVADKLGKFVTVTNVQNPTGKEAKFVIKSNEHPEDYVNVIAMGNGVKAYGYKDSERVSIFNNASLSAAIQKLIDSVCDLFDIQKPINESYTERKNFIMKEQITKILEAYNSGVISQEEAFEKINTIQEEAVEKVVQEDAITQKLKDMANNWDEDYYQKYKKSVDDDYKNIKYGSDGKPENPKQYEDWLKRHDFAGNLRALRPKYLEFRNAKEHDDFYNSLHHDPKRVKEMEEFSDAHKRNYADRVTKLANDELGIKESAIMSDLRVKQDKIMESFKMGIINATEGMRLIERVMMEADYITEEEDTAYEGDDDNEPEDITPEDTDGDTVDSDDTNIDALADYINSLSDDEKTALMSKLSGSDEPTDDDANGNEEVPTDDTATEGEPTTEETVDPASVSDASLNDANASLDDMEV